MSALISLDTVYVLTGALLVLFSILTWRDTSNPHRHTSAAFWFLFGVVFALGSVMPHWLTGVLVLAMVAIDGFGRVSRGKTETQSMLSTGNRIFLPVLVIPLVTVVTALAFRFAGLDANRGALVGLGFGSLAAMAVALQVTRATLGEMFREGHRLNDAMGAVNILPQLLAALGVVFTAAKVGELIAKGIQSFVSPESLFLLVLANCAGMTMFTFVMGNSFAAFPVIAAGVTVPLLVKALGADPALAGIVTLTAGSSGTLVTMMAANFNVVPAALLEMKDYEGVIRFQAPYAAMLWVCHVLLLWGMILLMRAAQ